jgi:hypothetical protein
LEASSFFLFPRYLPLSSSHHLPHTTTCRGWTRNGKIKAMDVLNSPEDVSPSSHPQPEVLNNQNVLDASSRVEFRSTLRCCWISSTYASELDICLWSFGIVIAARGSKCAALGAVNIVHCFVSLTAVLQRHEHEFGRVHTAMKCGPSPTKSSEIDGPGG